MKSRRGTGRSKALLRLSTRKLVGCILVIAFILLAFPVWWTTSHLVQQQSLSPPPPILLGHDPYVLKKHPPLPLNVSDDGICDVPPGQGEEGPAGIRGLYKIQQAISSSTLETPPPGARVLCMVYTHSNRHDVLRYITQTYATRCDGFFAASNLTDPTIGAWALSHPGPESYENMWNKVQHMWLHVYRHHIMDFDWFHIGGDDMFVIPDNLRRLASQYDHKKPQAPMYLGASIPNSKNPKRRYCGGGAGYTLNRHAVYVLVRRFLNGECPAAMASDEDVRIGRCLEDAGIRCQDTNDPQMEVRYHHLDVQFHSAWIPSRPALWLWEKLQYFHDIRGNQTQLAQISNTTTTFHLDKGIVRSLSRDRGIRRYHAILYQQCGTEFQNQVELAATCTKEEQKRSRQKWEQVPKAAKKK